jgi:hypothetical protein
VPGQARRPRAKWYQRPAVCRGRSLDCPDGQRGATCHRHSATGAAFPRAFAIGSKPTCSSGCRLNPDMEYAMVDSTIVKVHRHGQSAKGDQAIGRSKGGMTTKILALTRCAGQPHPICPSAGTALRYGLCSAAAPMPNQDRRTILSRQHALGRDYRFRQRCQWVLDGCGIEPRCLQSCNHLGPA